MKSTILYIFLLLLPFQSCKKNDRELLNDGLDYYKEKKYRDAIKLFNEVLKSNNKLQEAYYNRAFCYWKLNQKDSALIDFQKVLDLHYIGNFKLELNKNSTHELEEAEFQVNYNEAIYQKAQLEYELNDLKSSFNHFKTLIDENFEKSNCYLWLGTIMLRNDKSNEAYKYFKLGEKAASNREDSIEAYRLLKQFDTAKATKR